jgi:hypothetical protein
MPTFSKVYHRPARGHSGSVKRNRRRTQLGSQISEFGGAIIILVVFVLIPMLDFVVVPIRWMMAQEIVNNYARKLAMCETLSQSYATMEADPSLKDLLQNIGGVQVKLIDMHVRISRTSTMSSATDVYIVNQPRRIPAAWLPIADNQSRLFSLELIVHSNMSPAILLSGINWPIPGITAPIPMLVTASHEWGNLGRNPRTGNYFINE